MVKTIAEFYVRKCMIENDFSVDDFTVEMRGREGVITDINGDHITLVYDEVNKRVYLKEA